MFACNLPLSFCDCEIALPGLFTLFSMQNKTPRTSRRTHGVDKTRCRAVGSAVVVGLSGLTAPGCPERWIKIKLVRNITYLLGCHMLLRCSVLPPVKHCAFLWAPSLPLGVTVPKSIGVSQSATARCVPPVSLDHRVSPFAMQHAAFGFEIMAMWRNMGRCHLPEKTESKSWTADSIFVSIYIRVLFAALAFS